MSMKAKSMDLEQVVGNVLQTTSNLGGTIGLALPIVGQDAPFRGLTAGTGITLTVLGDSSVEIAANFGAVQTPWLSDIDGNGFQLQGATNILLEDTSLMQFSQYFNDFTATTRGANGNAMTLSTTDAPRIVVSGATFTGGINPTTPATASITLTSAVAGDIVTVDGLNYVGVAGVKADNTEFDISISDNAAAIDLADSISFDARAGILGHVNATPAGNNINLTAVVPFTIGVLDFSAPINGAGKFNYGLINTVVWDNGIGTAGSEVQLIARYQDTPTIFLEVNPVGNSLRSRFFFELEINGGFLSFVNNVGVAPPVSQRYIQTVPAGFELNVDAGFSFSMQVQTAEIFGFSANGLDYNDNNALNVGYVDMTEISEPAAPDATHGRLWVDAAVIVNDHSRLLLKDSTDINFDCTASGMVVNTYNTEAIADNHYLALSGINGSNATFINRAVVLPRSFRFYNLYIVVTTNSTSIVTNCALNDGAASPTILSVDIPIGTTGIFFNADDFVDLQIATEVAYGFGLTTGGTLTVAAVGMAMDTLRVVV